MKEKKEKTIRSAGVSWVGKRGRGEIQIWPTVTAGVATGGLNGWRLMVVKPMAGLRACGECMAVVLSCVAESVSVRRCIHAFENRHRSSAWNLCISGSISTPTGS